MARLFGGLNPLLSDDPRLEQPVLFARKLHDEQYKNAQSEPGHDNQGSIADRRRGHGPERAESDEEKGECPEHRKDRVQNDIEFIPPLTEIVKEYTEISGTKGKDQGEGQQSPHEIEFHLRPDPPA